MLVTLLQLLSPGLKIPPDATQFSVEAEGLRWGWAFFLFVVLAMAVGWSYQRYAARVGLLPRAGMAALRCALLGLAIILLVRPFLLVTIEEPVRRPLLVLLDLTQSMTLVDHRMAPEDIVRAGIAMDRVNPAGGLRQTPPDDPDLKQNSRWQLLQALAANARLNLWPRLQANADLRFYGFGREVSPLGDLAPSIDGQPLTLADSAAFFQKLQADQKQTALGDSLHQMLDDQRGQPLAGILVITDGANNTGTSPLDAAAIAQEDGVPLFLYGIGVSSPQDIMVKELIGPQAANVKEKVLLTVRIRAQGMVGQKTTVRLTADGKVVDEEPVEFRADGDQELTVGYTPAEVGTKQLEASIVPLPEEAVKDNNSASMKLRVGDDKINVLYIETEPTWDFQYLLAMMQRDRRLKVKCVLLKGDADLPEETDSPFLAKIPDDQAGLFANDVVILGDVDPGDLGPTRIKLLNDWVNKMGGGIVFRAGPHFNPSAFAGTGLEPLLPVEISGRTSERYTDPVSLTLTPEGETSPLLNLAANPEENAALWKSLPGFPWTAWVGRAHPGAHALLADPTSTRATRDGPMPVIAMQPYGLGETVFIGLDETYRWRSHVGEKYYTQIWGQIIQALAGQRMLGSSPLTQLRSDRPWYRIGDRVRISARVFNTGFVPVTDPELPVAIAVQPEPSTGQAAVPATNSELRLQAVSDQPGEYRGEMTANAAGDYSVSTARDPSVVLKLDVTDPRIELADTAMNDKLLQAMAAASGGQFVREEDLQHLPEAIKAKSVGNISFQKIPLFHTPFILGLMIVLACLEWFWRRKLELK